MQDSDLRQPEVRKRRPRREFKVTTEEVLRKADFRVSFACHFSAIFASVFCIKHKTN